MRRACMVVHSFYPADPRVRRETEALLDAGWEVDVVCLRRSGEKATEVCSRATVYRLPIQRHRGSGLSVYLLEYSLFFIAASLRVTLLHIRRHYDFIQTHNMPDFIVFTAFLPRLLGARVILDMHDLVPELFAVRFAGGGDRPVVRFTRWVERISTAFAEQVITAGEPFRRRLIARHVPSEKVTVIMNSADPRLFQPGLSHEVKHADSGGLNLMYHGGLYHRCGLDLAIRAVEQLRGQIPGLKFRIYGDGEAVPELEELIKRFDLAEHVQLGGFVPIDKIPALITWADLGVVPNRLNPFTDLQFPTKAFEYISMGVPVIIARTTAVEEMFGDIPDLLFRPEDVDELAERILALHAEPARRQRLLAVSQEAYAPYVWDRQRQKYLTLVDQLVSKQVAAPSVDRPAGE